MSAPAKRPELEIRAVGKDVLVHDLARGKIHVLNATAARVLELCDGSRTVETIVETMSQTSPVDRATVRRDVAAILETFEALNLIT